MKIVGIKKKPISAHHNELLSIRNNGLDQSFLLFLHSNSNAYWRGQGREK